MRHTDCLRPESRSHSKPHSYYRGAALVFLLHAFAYE
jgi:hypothetical protein